MTVDVTLVQRRTVATLVASQAVGAMGITIGVATASLLARDLSGSDQQAGLAQTSQVFGAALASYVLARVMSLRGRRFGLAAGYFLGSGGAAVAVLAAVLGSMPLLLVGTFLLGATTSAGLGARCAATDLAPDASRGRSLSIVVWATTIGAVLGPNLTGPSTWFADRLDIPELAGPFALGAVGIALAGVIVLVLLRPDPLLLARERAGVSGDQPAGASWGRALAAVRAEPMLAAAVIGMATAHATMIAVMAMTPLHMEHGGAALRVIGFVISVHVLGMFAFSPLVGWAADRFGRGPVLSAGGLVLVVSLVVCGISPQGSSWQIFVGLFLLGLGWSLATVAAATMVADHAPLEVRTDVQGSADLMVGLTAAVASALAGVTVGAFGFPVLATLSVGLAAVTVGSGMLATRRAVLL